MTGVLPGALLIAAERERQVSEEGWTPEHDDAHVHGELAQAAALYANPPLGSAWATTAPAGWPWSADWWKPRGQVDNLVRAGALIAAEIDRLQRSKPDQISPERVSGPVSPVSGAADGA